MEFTRCNHRVNTWHRSLWLPLHKIRGKFNAIFSFPPSFVATKTTAPAAVAAAAAAAAKNGGTTTHGDIPVVHVAHGIGDLQHDVGGLSLALEVVRHQQIAPLTQVLTCNNSKTPPTKTSFIWHV